MTSKPVTSSQQQPHQDLPGLVRRHCLKPWRKPTPTHSHAAFEEIQEWLGHHAGRPVILDSFCGTGMSSALLAKTHPDAAVIGIDKSAHRLSRHRSEPYRYLLVRTECEPLWQLLASAGIRLHKHYLLYPNPWPKPGQVQRRIHGHPAFPLLGALGGTIELRSNWDIYAQEFHLACSALGLISALEALGDGAPISLFEKKYREQGHPLWQVRARPSN